MAKIEFDFKSPLTSMRRDANGSIRPEYSGELHAIGIANYDPGAANKDYRITYTLTHYTFHTDVKREDLDITKWAGGSLISLEEAHDLIILHIEKLFGLDTEPTCSLRVYHYECANRGGFFTLHYMDTNSGRMECQHNVSETEFAKWLTYSGRAKSGFTYWGEASIQQKKRDFSKYLCDVMDFMTAGSGSRRVELEFRDAPMGTL